MIALVIKRFSRSVRPVVLATVAVLVSVLSVRADTLPEYRDVRILESSGSSIRFVYIPEPYEIRVDEVSGERMLDVPRCALNEEPGLARIPIRKVIMGIPAGSEPHVSVISSNYKGIDPISQPLNRPHEETPFDNARFQRAKATANYPVLSTHGPYFIRDQRILELLISPVRISSGGIASALADEIEVLVEFDAVPETGALSLRDDAFEKIFRATLLNYEQAKNWRVPRQLSLIAQKRAETFDPFAYSASWVKIGIEDAGVYKISGSAISNAGLDIASIDPTTLRVFWMGGRELPNDNSVPRPEFSEIAIKVDGEADGILNAGDEIIFYSHGADFLNVDPSKRRPEFVSNGYTSTAYLWLTHGGSFPEPPKRMGIMPVAPDASDPVLHAEFHKFRRFEENRFLEIGSGGYVRDYYRWFWRDEGDYTIDIQLDDVLPLEACTLLVTSLDTSLEVKVNDVPYVANPNDSPRVIVTDAFYSGLNTIEFHQVRNYLIPLLDYFEIIHPTDLKYTSGSLDFYTYNGPGDHRYTVVNSGSEMILLSIADVDNQAFLTDFVIDAGSLSFDWSTAGSRFEHFALVSKSQMLAPKSLHVLTQAEPRVAYDDDLIIVAPESFRSAIEEYVRYRDTQGYSIALVDLNDIYRQYSAGMFDPIAIRDFLKYNFENSASAPGAALIVGDGHYDFRNYLGRNQTIYLPPYVAADDRAVTDENFVYFAGRGILDSDTSYGIDRGVDMVITRWPVRSPGEIGSYIQKLISYEKKSNYGPWRNLITLVADDEFKKDRSKVSEAAHTRQTEILANEHLPSTVDVQKIYLTDYPFDSFNHKPKARDRIIQAVNDGTVLINYIGHGNPDLWADERVFYWKEDLFKLTNRNKLSVFFNASCSIGKFDSPLREAMAEELFRYDGGGAIGALAATRFVFSGVNARFNYKAFDLLFGEGGYSLCEAVYVTKLLRQIPTNDNDRLYIVFGDPLMRFGIPDRDITFTSISPDSLTALALTTVEGYVADTDGSIDESFDGDVYVTVYDAIRNKVKELDENNSLNYKLPGPRIFRGKGTVTDGLFELSFIVPKDISYGENSAKIIAYAVNEFAQASGAVDSIEVSGSNPTITDTTGPVIELKLAAGGKFAGGLLEVGEHLKIVLSDSSGINLSGEVGHGIEVGFDDEPLYDMDLTDDFVYYPESFRSGEVEFQVPSLALGSHTLRVKSWDSANNSSMMVLNVAVGETEDFRITGIANYPNPASGDTRFSYFLSEPVRDVSIKIYTLRGRLIETLRNQSSKAGHNLSSVWNLLDNRGDKLANGVYIYKITASGRLIFPSEGDNDIIDGFGKLVVLK
jgi:hypothetical protein